MTHQVKYQFNFIELVIVATIFLSWAKLWFGGVLKVRDADLCVTQNGSQNCYDNIGPSSFKILERGSLL